MTENIATSQLDPADLLRQAGLRVTAGRVAVIKHLQSNPHTNADNLLIHVRQEIGAMSRQAMYDALHALADAGVVRVAQLDQRSVLYEINHGDNHHHLVCRSCGQIEDVPCAIGHAPCLEPVIDHGFLVDEAEVIYRGTCASCLAAAK
ncbi:transcriptional repressor [Boudabousia tangfeifanii]|uniref:Transcriptional repressor n=1 Tax=Boudabousia tangfeifanii TaxID=1912795 RepID=A0A1D9MIL0_9ACTO|nr:Fur family transcriptional regulator [Boudabousia tangfeifanii]AOZ72137.1 transcriptional repressor [Boudabousia tangfeifanii]